MQQEKEKKRVTFRFNDETLGRLDEILRVKYKRAAVDRTQAVRWLIDDAWEDLQVKDNTNTGIYQVKE